MIPVDILFQLQNLAHIRFFNYRPIWSVSHTQNRPGDSCRHTVSASKFGISVNRVFARMLWFMIESEVTHDFSFGKEIHYKRYYNCSILTIFFQE